MSPRIEKPFLLILFIPLRLFSAISSRYLPASELIIFFKDSFSLGDITPSQNPATSWFISCYSGVKLNLMFPSFWAIVLRRWSFDS